MLLLPALNARFDITTTRTEAAKLHPPVMIFAMLGALDFPLSARVIPHPLATPARLQDTPDG
jgi:hypothetical protein